jgi:hypothetical protein
LFAAHSAAPNLPSWPRWLKQFGGDPKEKSRRRIGSNRPSIIESTLSFLRLRDRNALNACLSGR